MKLIHEEKFRALYEMICSISEQYLRASDAQKQLIETTIGAGIFYLPKNKKINYSGYISEEALRTGERVEEHFYPRKVSANMLLSDPPSTLSEFVDVVRYKYMGYHYTTKEENQNLKEYQKVNVFVSPEDSYQKAGITLVKLWGVMSIMEKMPGVEKTGQRGYNRRDSRWD